MWNEGTSSICDSTGALLFYSNGVKVWDRTQQVMTNGSNLMGHASSTHAALIIARPGSDQFFHVFTTDGSENDYQNGLRHSVVDICMRNGLGDVVNTEKNVLLHGNMAEKIAAVRHANGVDYWIATHEYGTNVFHTYLLTANGVTDSIAQAIGPIDDMGCGAQIVFNPTGTSLAYATISSFGLLALYDFDPATGVFSNERVMPNTATRMVWGLAFSPDGSKLYLTTNNNGSVRQLNLNAGSWTNIQASEIVLGTLVPDLWRDLRLGPDGVIYVTHANSPSLGTISSPNALGTACQFQDMTIALTANCSFGLPSVVAGYSYSNHVQNCGKPNGIEEQSSSMTVGPNPVNDLLHLKSACGGLESLVVSDLLGRPVYQSTGS
ncbi:MAG: hypothetical protein IPK99_00425 [Flavobacteriales bacterium]|nr:hypothetical protein [Flavobacteriales bacterium]